MSFEELLYGIALVVSALVSLLMLSFARSFLGFLALVVGSVANYTLMLFLAWFVAPYWAFAYAVLSLIAGALIETVICDKEEAAARNSEMRSDDNFNDDIDDTKGGAP